MFALRVEERRNGFRDAVDRAGRAQAANSLNIAFARFRVIGSGHHPNEQHAPILERTFSGRTQSTHFLAH